MGWQGPGKICHSSIGLVTIDRDWVGAIAVAERVKILLSIMSVAIYHACCVHHILETHEGTLGGKRAILSRRQDDNV